jgi:CheY-like chemotaxis protein/HPt (histidine-containing phosphotransfer) domain-containing protein
LLFLVVDDDALSRDLLMLLLEAEGYEVETAASGEAAVARAASCAKDGFTQPEVILTDMQMPGLAGNALATALRTELGEGTLLLAMSGSQPPASALTGFDAFLLKPFAVGELNSMVQRKQPGPSVTARAAKPRSVKPRAATPRAAKPKSAGRGSEEVALDESIYAKMCDLMPAAQLGQMYALCIDDARKRIACMGELAAAADDARYRKEAHAVKGGSGMIGASELYALAAAAEQHGLSSHHASSGTTSVTATLAQLSLACDRLERILQERTRE